MTEKKINKVVIFVGGKGSRLSEYTDNTPKPLVEVAGEPIVLHIMRQFYKQGYTEFILALGYKSMAFKRFFRDYAMRRNDMTVHPDGRVVVHQCENREKWTVHLVETGEESTTGQRLNNVKNYIGSDDFFMTYGDSISDVPLAEVERNLYENPQWLSVMTAVSKSERFGVLDIESGSGHISRFEEKAESAARAINGGFIACRNELLEEITPETGDLSFEVFRKLANDGTLGSYWHEGFWRAMDTKRDRDELEELAATRTDMFS